MQWKFKENKDSKIIIYAAYFFEKYPVSFFNRKVFSLLWRKIVNIKWLF